MELPGIPDYDENRTLNHESPLSDCAFTHGRRYDKILYPCVEVLEPHTTPKSHATRDHESRKQQRYHLP